MTVLKLMLSFCVVFIPAPSFASYLAHNNMFKSVTNIADVDVKLGAILLTIIVVMTALYFVALNLSIYTKDCKDIPNLNGYWFSDTYISICITWLRIFILLIFCMGVICSFNVSLIADEAFTFELIEENYFDVVKYTAMDVHPPLYYLMLKILEDIVSIFTTEFMIKIVVGKLFSVFIYMLTAIMCFVKLRKTNKSRGFMELLVLTMFLPLSIDHFAEVRMYGLAMFFVTGCLLYAYDIIAGEVNKRTWMMITIFSICAAYTHNYALISVAAVWLCLFIYFVINDKKKLKGWFLFGIITALGYFPWLLVLLKQTAEVSESYWIGNLSTTTIIGYVTSIFPLLLILVPFLIIWYFCVSKIKLIHKEIFIGALVLLITLVVGIAASLLIRPVFIIRYVVPCYLCMWITILLCWLKLDRKGKVVISGLIVICCAISVVPYTLSEIKSGIDAQKSVQMIQTIEENDIICVEYNAGNHVLDTVASYTEADVYSLCNDENTISDLFLAVFENEIVADDELIKEFVSEGVTVYYITANDSADFITEYDDITECLGTYLFDEEVLVYKISLTG